MNKFLKRGAALLLSIVMTLSLCACSEESQELFGNIAGDLAVGMLESVLNGDDSQTESGGTSNSAAGEEPVYAVSLDEIPEFNGEDPYVVINGNEPYFTDEEKTFSEEFLTCSELDSLGRCGACWMTVCQSMLPTEERGDISSVKPTGWEQNKYDFVDGKYVYNRSHILGYQLSGLNDDPRNLITGTRYMNVDGMLPFENMVADYAHETENHVLYRVTPIFQNDELLCRGVLMEAYSMEDDGDGVCFNVYCYNVQPGVAFDYATGENWLA